MSTPDRPLTTAEFVEQLEQRVAPRDPHALLDVLRIVAASVPATVRQQVLEEIPAATAPTDPELSVAAYPELPEASSGAELLEIVDSFVRRLEDGQYYDTMDWDEELGEERAWGDDSWAREMDELLGRAATAYLSGNPALAARVYGRLLACFRHADRPGVFCGPEAPADMVQTDLSEAKRRYFRSLYRVTEPSERPSRLLQDMELLRSVGDSEVGLRLIADTEPDGDPPLERIASFLPPWIALLKGVRYEPTGWGREARRLLREAVEMAEGADGLGRLAREDGAQHPEAYHEWVGLLVRLDRLPEAVRAAREGVSKIRDTAYRARMADRLAALAAAQGDMALAVEGARAAWRAAPTEVRLLHLVTAAEESGSARAILDAEAAAVLRPDWTHPDALACRLLLLVGRTEEATTRFQRADALGWGRADHAGSVVLPFLLLASTDLDDPPSGSAIEALWQDLDVPGRNYFDRRLLLDRMSAGVESPLDTERPYSALLLGAVRAHRIPAAYRPRTVGVAQLKVEAAIRDILDGQHRRGHLLAAQLTSAVAETLILVHDESAGLQFFRSVRRRYKRYGTFVEALGLARERSPLLPDRVASKTETVPR